MKEYICDRCGGHINVRTMKCEYLVRGSVKVVIPENGGLERRFGR